MNLNLLAAVFSVIVVIIGFYEIFGLGMHTWSIYLSTFLFALVVVICIYQWKNPSK